MEKIQPSKKRKKKNIPYLGPNLLFYCYDCSLPIISSNTCPICDNRVNLVPLTPPYDVRPSTPYETSEIIELIKTTFGNEFGAKGSALVALVTLGIYRNYHEAKAKTVKFNKILKPDKTIFNKYSKIFQIYKSIYKSLWDQWDHFKNI